MLIVEFGLFATKAASSDSQGGILVLMPKQKSLAQVTPEGYEIPVPKRGEFDANLDKLLKAPKPPKKVSGRRQVKGIESR
jgi:hypothetical protein